MRSQEQKVEKLQNIKQRNQIIIHKNMKINTQGSYGKLIEKSNIFKEQRHSM